MRLADPAADAVHKAGGKDGGGAPPPHGQDQIPEVGLFQRDGRKTVAGILQDQLGWMLTPSPCSTMAWIAKSSLTV